MSKNTMSARLSQEEMLTVKNLAIEKKISTSKALAYIINNFAASQNNSPFLKLQEQLEQLQKTMESNTYILKTALNKVNISAKEAKYISLYHFATTKNPDIAKEYLSAAEKRARES